MAKRLNSAVKIRINHDRLEALHSVCTDMLQQLKPETEHEQLMRAYLADLQQQLTKKMQRSQDLYTLNMSGTEAVAFRQLWDVLSLKHDKYASIIVKAMLGQIDQYSNKLPC
ncbi:MAG: hypothetical protein H0X33_06980 [Taibaiella sp.]|nr:hypothetical protein [Taibaiella sp.]